MYRSGSIAGRRHERAGGPVQRARRLEFLTLAWNLAEAVVGIGAGVGAGSTSLIGFGLDSVIESLSGGVLLWRLRDGEAGERRERQAQKLVGVSFFVLALYVSFESVTTLWQGEAPDSSAVGLVLASVSLVVMPLLARAKRAVAVQLDSRALEADSRQTDLCAYLSAVLLVGLGLNAVRGWWWADPVAALAMVVIIVTEGRRALKGDTCATCHP